MKCSDVVGWDGRKCLADSAVCSYKVCLGQLGGVRCRNATEMADGEKRWMDVIEST